MEKSSETQTEKTTVMSFEHFVIFEIILFSLLSIVNAYLIIRYNLLCSLHLVHRPAYNGKAVVEGEPNRSWKLGAK